MKFLLHCGLLSAAALKRWGANISSKSNTDNKPGSYANIRLMYRFLQNVKFLLEVILYSRDFLAILCSGDLVFILWAVKSL